MTEIAIKRARDGDLAEIIRNFPRFWDYLGSGRARITMRRRLARPEP